MSTTETINAPTAPVLAAHAARIAADHARNTLEFEYDRQSEARQAAVAHGGFGLGIGDYQVEDAKRKLAIALTTQTEAETAVGGRVYRVNARNVSALSGHFAKLAKRAAKLDITAPTLTFDGAEIAKRRVDPGQGDHGLDEVTETYRYAIVTGQPVKLAGWEFVATLEHDHETGKAIIRRVPGSDEQAVDLTAYRNASANCDHCGQDRQRKDTYIVRHDDGDVKQVGSSCLKDFLGHGSPEQYARMAEWFSQLDEMLSASESDGFEGAGGPTGPALYPTDEFMAYVAVQIRTHGWVSRSQGGYGYGMPTADAARRDYGRVLGYIRSTKDDEPVLRPEPQDVETANAALAWVRDELSTGDRLSDYDHNLIAVCEADFLLDRRLGIAASAISAHHRHLEREIKRAQRQGLEELPDAGPYGQVKDKVDLAATVTRVIYKDSDYGTTTILSLVTPEGHRLKWFASRDPEVKQGQQVHIKGSVKDHGEWDGMAETRLTRCKLEVLTDDTQAAPNAA